MLPGPVYELGLGVEYVSVSTSTGKKESGFGGEAVFLRGSLLGALTRSLSDGTWLAGDYLGIGVGGWYGDEGHLRLPLELGAQFGTVLSDSLQLVVRGGVMGVGTTGGATSGGYGAFFGQVRGRWQAFALELTGAPRIDTDEGGAARLLGATARVFFDPTHDFGFRFMDAKRRIDPPSSNTLTDRTFLLFVSIEE